MAKKNAEIMLRKALNWFLYGDVGQSSKAILAATFDMEYDECIAYPHDSADLNRCIIVLDKIPEAKKGLLRLASIHPNWKVIFDNWDELTKLIVLKDGKCYHRIQELYEGIVHENEVEIGKNVTVIFRKK